MSHPVPVFYDPRQSCSRIASFSPSAGKPAKVMQDWLGDEKIAPNIEIMRFHPANYEMLYAAHSPAYVDGVLSLRLANGFGSKNQALADSLPFTVGSMVSAVNHVLTKEPDGWHNMAVSPTSGFHHAGHGFGGGYCTFNGLIVAAIHAHDALGAKRILILDCDQHYGNGTEDIIKRLGLSFITHVTAEKDYLTADGMFAAIEHALPEGATPYDLVLYQAGADMHVDDPLGGIATTHEMLCRDHEVFTRCVARGMPVVWNLAGGYSRAEDGSLEPVLALHRQTMKECLLWNV